MVASIKFYPVGNGDMTLIRFESGQFLLIDCRIRKKADDPDDDTPDVAKMLRDDLPKDESGRTYVHAFLLSHPDQDHCDGFEKHFHVGPLADYVKGSGKIVIRDMWSSPIVFRRASKSHVLCKDAKAFSKEARRRVERFRATNGIVADGDRILILGEDEDGKTDDLTDILVKVDEAFNRICGVADDTWSARLLAPLPMGDEEEEDLLSKNHSSVILNFTFSAEGNADAGRFLTGGDAEVAIWERLWGKHKNRKDWLTYDILQAPHHCSWHSLSYDSWSEKGEDAEVCEDARSALAQSRRGAKIIASSAAIKDDDVDPPCIRAKREYESIVDDVSGEFICVGEPENSPEAVKFEIGRNGPRKLTKPAKAAAIIGSGAVGGQPLGHG